MRDTIEGAEADDAALQALLIRHEGLRLKPYRDTVGKLTIGVGRNLDDVGISEAEALDLLGADLLRVQTGLDRRHPWWRSLDPVRRHALIDMAFNLGPQGLDGFTLTLAGIRGGAYAEASREMLRSRWAEQVGARAVELAHMIQAGTPAAPSSTSAHVRNKQ